MRLYRYRSIEKAKREIGSGTLYFAARNELNDPLEGSIQVYWQSDKNGWEGLLRNYICSLYHAFTGYQLRVDSYTLHSMSVLQDLHKYDQVPLGQLLESLGNEFLLDSNVQMLTRFYGENQVQVWEKELRAILRMVHSTALCICAEKACAAGTMSEDDKQSIIHSFSSKKNAGVPVELMDLNALSQEQRFDLLQLSADMIKDLYELLYCKLKQNDRLNLFDMEQPLKQDATQDSPAQKRRDWFTIAIDFPEVYTNQIQDMLFPDEYIVCFSAQNNNDVMWGNYADSHRGVCLVFDTGNTSCLNFGERLKERNYVKRVTYQQASLSCNFFEVLGKMTRSQVETWLTGDSGISISYKTYQDENSWRENYWHLENTKTFCKSEAWAYEYEYRIAVKSLQQDYSKREARCRQFDPRQFVGVIFGANTSEQDKEIILTALQEHHERYQHIKFYQAEYNGERSVSIREKLIWNEDWQKNSFTLSSQS